MDRIPHSVAREGAHSASPHLLLVVTEDWYFWSHRRPIARAALAAGYRVTLAARFGAFRGAIEALGVRTEPIALRRTSRNPVSEAWALGDLVALYRRLQPDIVHHVAVKPVLYGSLAARLAGVPRVVNAIAGLGYVFTGSSAQGSFLARGVLAGYRAALKGRRTMTIFQNEDDRNLFVQRALVARERTVVIRGSGVDTHAFQPTPEPAFPVVLYAGRMLWSKGVADLVRACEILWRQGLSFRLQLVGHADEGNPEAIPEQVLRQWASRSEVDWGGRREDMPQVMQEATVVVLASEREGVPKVLLEAASSGRPIVASDVPGCREVVEPGVNGLLVPRKDPGALAAALGALLENAALRAKMGEAGRRKAEREFSDDLVAAQTLTVYGRMGLPVADHGQLRRT